MDDWKRRLGLGLRRLKRFIARASGTPHQIALGVAIGFFLGWLPVMGIQMGLAVALCGVLRCNPIVPLLPIWLTNPVTFLAVYGFNYQVGQWLIGGKPRVVITGELKAILTFPDMAADVWSNPPLWLYSWVAEFIRNVRVIVDRLFGMGVDIMAPLWLGSAIVGLLLAIPSYYYTRWAVAKWRSRRERVPCA